MSGQVFQRNIFQHNVFQIGMIEKIVAETTANQGSAVVAAELGTAKTTEATATFVDRQGEG